MAEVSIKGALRSEFGKGASRRIRRDGSVPAVIYGHGEKPIHISLPAREVGVAMKTSNVLLNVDVPVHAHGKYDPEGILEHVHNTIEVEVDVTAIPASLDLDIEGLMAGDSKTASEVTLPAGVILKSDPKMTVIHLSVRVAFEEVVAVAATPAEGEAAAAAAPAEGAPAEESKEK